MFGKCVDNLYNKEYNNVKFFVTEKRGGENVSYEECSKICTRESNKSICNVKGDGDSI